MKYLLSDICDIQQGRNVNSSEFTKNGQHIYMNIKDLYNNVPKFFTRTDAALHSRYFAEKEDILFSIRGKFQAYQLPDIIDAPVIASSVFAILRPKLDMVLPSYLLWYLNHPCTQTRIQQASPANSRMPFLSLKTLKNVEIELPILKRQKVIIEIDNLHQKEIALYHKISELKKQYTQTILLNSITQ